MTELPKAYEANSHEQKWYERWQQQGCFTANPESEKPGYCIVIPPPNVTGVLHMGHALDNTLQDILARWKRMSGFEVLWLPGTDHAGIATQTVVERHLIKTLHKRRSDFSREEFLRHIWTQKEASEKTILSQLKRLGCSLDWTRTRFTMDEGFSHSVRVMFKKLFDDGLIYRGDYLVNWDPITQTALADDEVEYEEKNGYIYYFSYPLTEGPGSISFATTRPETMLGDTALAVAPKDSRYEALVGTFALQPLTNRRLVIIADDHVDPSFGTGCVKVTPAHDLNDYDMGQRHNLLMINIMTDDGKINDVGGEFEGLTMLEAREAVIKKMKALGYFVKQEAYSNRIGVSYRSKAIIEPHLSKQWFVKMSAFKEKLKHIVMSRETKLVPQNFISTYCHWIDNLRDWCISRQLVWGHQIPIWYHIDNPEELICYDGKGVPEQVQNDPTKWRQDPDVLDTWFSSSLWPFATLGWPRETTELQKFYPNSTLITGHDILFFWVARMLMMGSYALTKPPFPETFLHGLIYSKSYYKQQEGGGIVYVSDQERKEYDLGKPCPKEVTSRWEKMSKTKGNVIDPIEVIGDYGADACRMALAFSTTDARQIDLDRRRFEEFKNFANKVWNGARFVLMNINENMSAQTIEAGIDHTILTLEDRWILEELRNTVTAVTQALSTYAFDKAAKEAYEFFWNKYCAFYVEIVKPVLFGKIGDSHQQENKQKILIIVLLQALRLLHPMAPFITEELFSHIKQRLSVFASLSSAEPYMQEALLAIGSSFCMMAPFPKPMQQEDDKAKRRFEMVEKAIYTIRNIRGEMKITPQTATEVFVVGSGDSYTLLQEEERIISSLVKISRLHFAQSPPTKQASSMSIDGVTLFIPLPQELLIKEKERLQKEEGKILAFLEKGVAQLDNPQFLEKAPPHLIEKHNAQIKAWQQELERIRGEISAYK